MSDEFIEAWQYVMTEEFIEAWQYVMSDEFTEAWQSAMSDDFIISLDVGRVRTTWQHSDMCFESASSLWRVASHTSQLFEIRYRRFTVCVLHQV